MKYALVFAMLIAVTSCLLSQPAITIDDYGLETTRLTFNTSEEGKIFSNTITQNTKDGTKSHAEAHFFFDSQDSLTRFETVSGEAVDEFNFDYTKGIRTAKLYEFGTKKSKITYDENYGIFLYTTEFYHNLGPGSRIYTFSATYFYDTEAHVLTMVISPFLFFKTKIAGNESTRINNGSEIAKIVRQKNVLKFLLNDFGKYSEVQSLNISPSPPDGKVKILYDVKFRIED